MSMIFSHRQLCVSTNATVTTILEQSTSLGLRDIQSADSVDSDSTAMMNFMRIAEISTNDAMSATEETRQVEDKATNNNTTSTMIR